MNLASIEKKKFACCREKKTHLLHPKKEDDDKYGPVLLELAPGFSQICPVRESPVQIPIVSVVPTHTKEYRRGVRGM